VSTDEKLRELQRKVAANPGDKEAQRELWELEGRASGAEARVWWGTLEDWLAQ